jgi:MFS family permease
MFSSLKVRDFRIYWFGMLVSLIGTWVQSVAQSWLVFQLTNSAFLLGFVGFLNSIPIFALSLFGGVLADRVNKRNILIATQIAFMVLAFLLAILTHLGKITPLQLMVIAFLNGVIMAFDAPSRQAMVVEMVGKAHLPNAIALNSVAFNSSRIIGPALAGIFVASIGMSGCFYINGISFLAVIVALLLININAKKTPASKSILKDLKEGILFVKHNRTIFTLIAMVGVVSLFGVSYIILMPVFADNVLHVGVKGLGGLMSCSGLGALIGALVLARLGDFKYKGRFLIISSLLFSVSLAVFALTKTYIASLLILIVTGAAGVSAIALVNTLLQSKVPDAFRGRVMSVFMLTFAGMTPFGNLIAGSLSQGIGVAPTFLINGVICTVIFLAVFLGNPGIREIT